MSSQVGCGKEERLGTVGGRELAWLLLELCEDLVACKAIMVEGMGNWAQHQRSKEMIDVFDIEESLPYDGNGLVFANAVF